MSAAQNLHIHPVLENVLLLNLSNGLDETLRTMAHATCVFQRTFNAINWNAPSDYIAYLNIKSATTNGQIRFHFPHKALNALYQNMVGDNTLPSESEMIDVLGELSNVCYGIAKGRLNREGYSLGMALPLSGKTADVPQLDSARPNVIIPFNVFNETCYIQIVIL